MTPKASELQRAFQAACMRGDLVEQVTLAREAARRILIMSGIEPTGTDVVDELAGDFHPKDDWTDYCNHLNASYALGIAVGQLVSPRLFVDTKGGAR